MTDKLYNLMNWREIEAICYGDSDDPHAILGASEVDGYTLIQTFYPEADKVFCKFTSSKSRKEVEMEKVDEIGYFACLVKGSHLNDYKYKAVLEDGETDFYGECYNEESVVPEDVCKRFQAGVSYDIYQYLGAHPIVLNGEKGVAFAVWAPNAVRVSVVGDFNSWNGLRNPMRRLEPYGIFEVFVPNAKLGDNYKFEICIKGGATFMKADPYANAMQLRPENASVIADISKFKWTDSLYMKKREDSSFEKKPMNVYEVHLASFAKAEDGGFLSYKELAPKIVSYVLEMGYTHVELMPIMEHPLDESWGYQVIGYYAPTARYGTPQDFMYFVNEFHKAGIGVILDWVPAHFPRDTYGLSYFDGTCLYEHADPMRAYHPQWGTLNYNYGRTEVSNYLIANALFWFEMYHVDGIRVDAVASMLYLDYGKAPGQWYANIYGGNENLEAVEFIKHLNSIVHKKHPDVMMIAEESTAWPRVTGDLNEDGLGFDYKWNLGWMNDYLRYISYDPYFRSHHHNELTFSMIYAYTEKFMLEFSHDEVVHGKSSMLNKMPGTLDEKYANLRLSYAYMLMHPGKKLLFMGQDIAEEEEWNEKRSVQWDLLDQEEHARFQHFVKDCNHFYKEHPALFELDYHQDGFEWVNHILADQNMLIFLRHAENDKEHLLVVANFANVARNNYVVGVPFEGRYKEVFNSDNERYGGAHYINTRIKPTKAVESDYRPYSISIKVAPLSLSVFKFMGETIVSLEEEKKKRTSSVNSEGTEKTGGKKRAVITPMKNNKGDM